MNPIESSLFNSMDDIRGDDDKIFHVDDNHFLDLYSRNNNNNNNNNLSILGVSNNNSTMISTTTTTSSTSTSSTTLRAIDSTNYGFNLNLSALQENNNNNNNNNINDRDKKDQILRVRDNDNYYSPRRDDGIFKDSIPPRDSPRRRDNDNYGLGDPLSRVRDVDAFFSPRDPQMPRRESEGYYSPRDHTPRDLTPRGTSVIGSNSNNNNNNNHNVPNLSFSNLNNINNGNNNNLGNSISNNGGITGVALGSNNIIGSGSARGIASGDSENYYVNNSNDQNQRESYYSPRDLLRHSTENYSLPASRRVGGENVPESYYPGKDLNREHLGRGREEGYYSPREQTHSVLPPKPSPRDGYYVQPERTISHDSEQAYYGSREPTPRDHVYRRESSESNYYPSPRDQITSPRDNYYPNSREPTPRDHLHRPSSLQAHNDKSLPNPYAAPFVPQRSLSNPTYGVPPLQIPSLQFNHTHNSNNIHNSHIHNNNNNNNNNNNINLNNKPRNSSQQPIPYDYLQRPSSHLSVPADMNRQNQFSVYRNQHDAMSTQHHPSGSSVPVDQLTQHFQPTQSGSHRPLNVPPLSFSALQTSSDSEESSGYSSGYYSPQYNPHNPHNNNNNSARSTYSNNSSNNNLNNLNNMNNINNININPRTNLIMRNGSADLTNLSPSSSSPSSNRPHPMMKSNSEKLYDTRLLPYGRRNLSRSHTSSSGNLSGRAQYPQYEEEDKLLYYHVTPQQNLFTPPPAPPCPLKILSLDVKGCFNATDESNTLQRNAIFDFIDESKAQVILMYNTGLENEDQLKIVRNEVKTKYNTESAMWASFKSPGPDGGRGVGVLVLGPLAPRTGWIVSDSCGHILSASSRVKPGLPVLCFIACDAHIPTLEPTPFESLHADLSIPSPPSDKERKAKVYEKLKEIIETEQDKGVFVFAAGHIVSNIEPSKDEKSDEAFFNDIGVIRMTVTKRIENEENNNDNSNSNETSSISIDNNSTTTSILSTIVNESDDVFVTNQPFGDGPRPPDGTGMKVLSTEALTSNLVTTQFPTLIQIAIYGWPSETFVFTNKLDGPLGSGRKSRRSKSGRKKDENITQQLQQISITSPRLLQTDINQPSYILSLQSTLLNQSQQFGSILDSTITNNTISSNLINNHININNVGNNNINNINNNINNNMNNNVLLSPRSELKNWKMKVLEFITRLNDILHSTSWGVVRLDQMKYFLQEILIWVERINKIDVPGFPTSKTVSILREIFAYSADQFLRTAADMILQILQNWIIHADEILNGIGIK